MCKKIDDLGALAKQVGAYVYGDLDAPYYDFSEAQLRAFAAVLANQSAGDLVAWVTDGKEIDCAYKGLEPGGRLPTGTKLYAAMRAPAVEGN